MVGEGNEIPGRAWNDGSGLRRRGVWRVDDGGEFVVSGKA